MISILISGRLGLSPSDFPTFLLPDFGLRCKVFNIPILEVFEKKGRRRRNGLRQPAWFVNLTRAKLEVHSAAVTAAT